MDITLPGQGRDQQTATATSARQSDSQVRDPSQVNNQSNGSHVSPQSPPTPNPASVLQPPSVFKDAAYSIGHRSQLNIPRSNFSSGSGPPASAVPPASPVTDARRPKSDAFFVDLTSPVSLKPISHASQSIVEEAYADSDDESHEAAQIRLSNRMLQAALNRATVLHERKRKLRQRAEHIKRKVLLQCHRERLMSLKKKAQVEFSQSAAAIKRQIFLQERTEYFGAMVERAHRVATLRRLDRCVALRKSVSQSFADYVSSNITLDKYLESEGSSPSPDDAGDAVNKPLMYSPTSPVSPSVASRLLHHSPTSPLASSNGSTTPTVTPTQATHIYSFGSSQTAAQTPASPLTKSTSMPELAKNLTASSKSTPTDPSKLLLPAQSAIEGKAPDLDMYLPPITRATLRELDVTEILANVQLRHDLLFDPEMQFRPNLDGERGTQREARSETFWNEIEDEIQCAEQGTRAWFRIPLLLLEVREIVRELIPSSEQFSAMLDEIMDIELITQALVQTRSLAAAAGGVVDFLAKHLHQYCAPCRDPLIDTMVEQFQAGEVTSGLRMCLEVLEHMKLDFANHHLKKLRPWIVENAVEFEWRYFKERFEAKLVSVDATGNWLEAALDKYPGKPPANVFNAALMDMLVDGEFVCNASNQHLIPETFRMDLSRLASYHNEYQDLSIMATLLMLFKQACGKAVLGQPLSSTSNPGRGNAPPLIMHPAIAATKATLWTLLNHGDTTMSHVATQLATDAGKLRGRGMTSAEVAALNRLVDTTLTFDHPLFMLLQKRVASELSAFLDNGGKLNPDEVLGRHGLLDIKEELGELGRKVKLLADHNRSTYRQLYDAMIENWTAGKKECVDGGVAPLAA